MDPLTILNDIRIASPCTAPWDDMEGGDRARFCLACQKRVYDLSALTAVESVALIERNEGSMCVRLYRRADGTVLTADCPVGLRARAIARLRRAGVGASALAAFLLTGAYLKARMEPESCSTTTTQVYAGSRPASLSQWFLEIFGLRAPTPPPGGGVTMGVMVPFSSTIGPTGTPPPGGATSPSSDPDATGSIPAPEGGPADGPADHPE